MPGIHILRAFVSKHGSVRLPRQNHVYAHKSLKAFSNDYVIVRYDPSAKQSVHVYRTEGLKPVCVAARTQPSAAR